MSVRYDDNELWYKDAIIYETHVRSFYDSNGDGIGDFKGLTMKLPYLCDLGITALWILPFYPSPLLDDGYDIADYCKVHPNYGTLEDFQEFLYTAHHLGIRVITELVLNHTSDQHPWFQKARHAKPGSPWRDFYVWSDTPDRYRDARIIFQDFESSNWSWDPVAKAYYWHRFYSHQPDLNYENPRVHRAMFRVIEFWLGMGVDGLRLDAVPYLYEEEGSNCENLPQTYAFLKKLRTFIDKKHRGRMLLAEANQWPEDAASYFGEGDACQMAFHFPLMPRMFMAVQMEDSFPIINILEQTPSIPDHCQWALFLRNHDELTLEMVTDEERDYMYRVYARDVGARINLGIRRRLAPLMGDDRRKIELMNVLLFSLPGTPIIYYGDEIGMGDNFYLGDRNGVRTPMQWSPDRNAGFSPANPQSIYLPVIIDPEYHFEVINVENQMRNPSSFLWWIRRMIELRKRSVALSRGKVEFLSLENPKVLAFIRRHENETVLVLINLSRFSQSIEISNARFAGYIPEDLFSRNRFPVIKDSHYVIILGPHDYHLLLMEQSGEETAAGVEAELQSLVVTGSWNAVLEGANLERLERTVLPFYVKKCRWFGGKGRAVNRMKVDTILPVTHSKSTINVSFVEVHYAAGETEVYMLPLLYVSETHAKTFQKEFPEGVIARLVTDEGEGILCDGMYSEDFHQALMELFSRKTRAHLPEEDIVGSPGRMFRKMVEGKELPFKSHLGKMEQSNTTILYDSTFFLKLYRRVEGDINPEVEVGRLLTEKARFPQVPQFAGTIEFRRPGAKPASLGILQQFSPNQGDGWIFTLHELTQYVEGVLAHRKELREMPELNRSLFDISAESLPPMLYEIIGGFFPEMAALLGKRTAELHRALASRTDCVGFEPEPYSLLHQRSIYQSIRTQTKKVMTLLRRNLNKLSPEVRLEADAVLSLEKEILEHARKFMEKKFSSLKIRIHGDYHLGQVLFTGKDFVIIDFEGEPAKAISERKIKRSPLRDVAGMIHSFHYAAHAVLLELGHEREDEKAFLEPCMETWHRYVAGTFLQGYLDVAGQGDLVPKDRAELEVMLNVFLLDKAIYVLGYELNNRPDWLMIPLKEIQAWYEALA